MKQKPERYYRIEAGQLCIYDSPYANTSVSLSIVSPGDMAWYRAHFRMLALAGEECPEHYR